MNAHTPIVLSKTPTSDAYRCAIETILRDVMRATSDSLPIIADKIDCCHGTLLNAFNKRSDLSPVFLLRVGAVYGPGFLNPVLGIIQAEIAPVKPKPTKDVLPIVTRVAHKIAMARDPEGMGGATEVPQERAGYLPDLKELHREAGNLVTEIEAVLG